MTKRVGKNGRLTEKQAEVLSLIAQTADPWCHARANGVATSGRRNTLRCLRRDGFITIGEGWRSAWLTDKGREALREVVGE